MAAINTKFGKDLRKFGAFDFNACYNCGTCTAICTLSTEEDSFPREMIRYSVLGMEDEIRKSLKPWLCYYCGDCTSHCPKTANPGELMMSLRRWLTSKYDWTGLSGLLYRSLPVTITAMVVIALGVIMLGAFRNFDLPDIMHTGHVFEMLAILLVFAAVFIPNLARMWWFTILKPGVKAPPLSYIRGLRALILHMFTQKRSLDCEENKFRWLEHLILVIGYLALLFITVALDWFSAKSLFVIIPGYVVSAIIFIVTIDFVRDRVKKNNELTKFSQPSDWMFVIWLSLMGLSAFAVRLFIDLGLLRQNLWLYIFHMIILVQWAVIIVPFGKWTHFLYRSFAIYFAEIKGQKFS
jgi:ferredoxin